MDTSFPTGEEQAQRADQDRMEAYASFFENAPVAMLLLDQDRQICQMNREASATFAGSTNDLAAIRFGDAVNCLHSMDVLAGCGHGPDCQECSVRRVVADTFETQQMHRQVAARLIVGSQQDSDDKHVLVSTAFTQALDGVHVLVCIEDVTDQKRAEHKLQEAIEEIGELKDRLQEENVYLREAIGGSQGREKIVGQSETLRLALSKVEHVAGTDANVLLLGETGTGKELFAQAIHRQSSRSQAPMIKVNCAALPSSLIESELFGHVQGAFTGALTDKVGRFQLADGGTIFLDEIGELDPVLQTKLLRVLQERELERIGSAETIKIDVRVIAATNRDVHEAIREGSLRPDLYYRLAVFPVEIPPLRSRRKDIPLLVWHFIEKKQRSLGKTISKISEKVMNALVQYDWPGNVRELENVIERAMILSTGPALSLEGAFVRPVDSPQTNASPRNLEEVQRAHIVGVLEECDWRIKGAGNTADRLGLKPSTLHYRMKKLGIERPPRRPR